MKKLFMYMIIIFSIMIIPINVNAFTTGSAYGTITTSNNNYNAIKNCGSNGYCNYGHGITSFKVVCDTAQCFIVFPATFTSGNFDTQIESDTLSVYTQVYADNNWRACETLGGIATCMVPNNSTVTNIEFKWYRIHTAIGMSYDLNFVNVFNSPANVSAQLDNLQQQQQAQHNQIMDSNNSTNQTDFITFATNYYIDDKTGTKSFLNVVPNFLNTLNNGTCTPLTLTIPFISKNNQLTIPCMVDFLGEHGFGTLIRIYQFVLSFIVAYWLTVNWFKLFKETIDPFNYRIEVMDL